MLIARPKLWNEWWAIINIGWFQPNEKIDVLCGSLEKMKEKQVRPKTGPKKTTGRSRKSSEEGECVDGFAEIDV